MGGRYHVYACAYIYIYVYIYMGYGIIGYQPIYDDKQSKTQYRTYYCIALWNARMYVGVGMFKHMLCVCICVYIYTHIYTYIYTHIFIC